MTEIENIWVALAGVVPLFSSFTWMFLLVLALRDSITKTERNVKMSFLLYLIAFTAGYLLLTLYTYRPECYVWFSWLTLAVFMTTPILFYRLVWILTDTGTGEKFHYLRHFPLPVALTLTLIIWSLFVPIEVQSDLVAGREVSSDYYAFSMLFESKALVRFIFVLNFIILSLVRLAKYGRAINNGTKTPKYLTKWLRFIIVLSLMLPMVTASMLIIPQQEVISSPLPIALMMIFVVFHSILGYNIIRRNFILYMMQPQPVKKQRSYTRKAKPQPPVEHPKRAMRQIAERVENEQGKVIAVSLTRKRFEEYFREHKPHLNPELKMTDLIEPLKANRTEMSSFINKTYGINFNRYINRLRIKELKRLQNLTSNREKPITQLLPKAGFSSMRNYTRALAVEQDNKTDKS